MFDFEILSTVKLIPGRRWAVLIFALFASHQLFLTWFGVSAWRINQSPHCVDEPQHALDNVLDAVAHLPRLKCGVALWQTVLPAPFLRLDWRQLWLHSGLPFLFLLLMSLHDAVTLIAELVKCNGDAHRVYDAVEVAELATLQLIEEK